MCKFERKISDNLNDLGTKLKDIQDPKVTPWIVFLVGDKRNIHFFVFYAAECMQENQFPFQIAETSNELFCEYVVKSF